LILDRRARVLVLDDDHDLHRLIRWMLDDQPYAVESAYDIDGARERWERARPDVMILDWQLGSVDALELLADIRRDLPDTPIVLITAYSSLDVAVEAIKLGAFDFLEKPLEPGRLFATLAKAVSHRELLMRVTELQSDLEGDADSFEGIIARSPQMRTVFSIIQNVAATDVSVMLVGESGTGKERVARAIHNRSHRREAPFLAMNMAALPRELVESTLFGHEKGSFTGADRQRVGACEEASGGTLFLDEVGAMPVETQPKLLRFLQEKRFRRVGGEADIETDVRIISATNVDPLDQVRLGHLRADLYYRLNVVPVRLPRLRNREGDIELLATQALQLYSDRYSKRFERVSPAAMESLTAYSWPGNVRQLLHLMERIVVLNDGAVLENHMLPPDFDESQDIDVLPPRTDLLGGRVERQREKAAPARSTPFAGREIVPLAALERQAIEHALEVCDHSAARAARSLGISEATMYRKLKAYGYKRPRRRALGAGAESADGDGDTRPRR